MNCARAVCKHIFINKPLYMAGEQAGMSVERMMQNSGCSGKVVALFRCATHKNKAQNASTPAQSASGHSGFVGLEALAQDLLCA
jgi:hypothetical protein